MNGNGANLKPYRQLEGFSVAFAFSPALLIAALVVGPMFLHAQAQRAPANSPAECVTGFFKWVIATMVTKRSPVKQKKVVASYLSESLYRWLYASADGDMRDLYFLASNDWSESWIGQITIVDSKVKDERAVVTIDLGRPEPPDNFVDHLRLNLKRESGKWKIDCIQNIDPELGRSLEFDPKLDAPGCKPLSKVTRN